MNNPPQLKGIQWISLGAMIIGLIFIIAGAILTGLAYTEITPPNYDDNYDRFIGSSPQRLLGPFILCFGAIIIFGSCGIFVLLSTRKYQKIPSNGEIKHYSQQQPQQQQQYFGKEDSDILSQKFQGEDA